jgi:hypothetical protein
MQTPRATFHGGSVAPTCGRATPERPIATADSHARYEHVTPNPRVRHGR